MIGLIKYFRSYKIFTNPVEFCPLRKILPGQKYGGMAGNQRTRTTILYFVNKCTKDLIVYIILKNNKRANIFFIKNALYTFGLLS